MSHRQMLGLHVLPVLGALFGTACGQTSNSPEPAFDEVSTSATSNSSNVMPGVTSMPGAPSAMGTTPIPPSPPTQAPASPSNPASTPGISNSSAPDSSAPDSSAWPSASEQTTWAEPDTEGSVTSGATGSSGEDVGTTADETVPGLESTSADEDSTQPSTDQGQVINGQGGVVNATIIVRAGQIYDGGGKVFTAGSALGDGSQNEDQLPVFRLEGGAQLRNVTLGSPAADGIHCYGDVTLNNIHWQDIGEDALTIKQSGTVVLDGGSAQNGDDKVFQVNAASTFIVRNFTAKNAGKFIRQNGDTTFRVDVVIEDCDISNMDECIFRTDSNSSTVTMRDTRYSDLGDGLFVGVNSSNITLSNNTEY